MVAATETTGVSSQDFISYLLSGERYWPTKPRDLEETGLQQPLVESLIGKTLLAKGLMSGHSLSTYLCLPFNIVEPLLKRLKSEQKVTLHGSGMLNDYNYALTEDGRRWAIECRRQCSYFGPAPIPLSDYIISVEAQAISAEAIRRRQLNDAFHDISVEQELLDALGPAVNSGSGLFLYGSPGNGKSTLAKRITSCFGQEIWLPHALIEGHEIIQLFDPAYHKSVDVPSTMNSSGIDQRWHRVRRPTVVVGGELTMENLEMNFDSTSNVNESPLQLKSNCGCLLIDDFGRQRVSPEDLLNRWIIPLENRHDFLTLGNGKKICVPFEQLIIFSTNLDPSDLVDEAFLRRIPYRIEVSDPSEGEFKYLFELASMHAGCIHDSDAVEYLLEKYYRPTNRPRRRCHPRDLVHQIRNYCIYNDSKFELRPEYFDIVASSFFTAVPTKRTSSFVSS